LFVTLLRDDRQYDIWYINGLELPAILAGKILRKRMIMKIVGDYAWERAINADLTSDTIDEFQHKRQRWQVELHKKLRAWLVRQVAEVITPSRYLQTLVWGWGVPEKRVHLVYNAVEEFPEALKTRIEVRKELGVSEQDKLIITVARLVKWKGIEALIRVVSHFDSSIKLLIVGDGPEKNRLTDVVKVLNLTSRIKFLGKAVRKNVLEYIRASDVFVLNTRYEGFSHVLLEAMSVGTPVVTTAVCGNPELVIAEQNGILVEYGQVVELEKQLERVLEDARVRKQLIEGGKRSLQQFTWDKLFDETIRILGGQYC
jgi:glycosyltransferase involved in cell wall biosynthesis